MKNLSRKDFMAGAVAGAAAFAAPRIFAKTKGEKMDNEMNSVEPSEFVARPFAQFGEGWFLLTGGDFSAKWNTMTVSWGFAGTMWGRPVVAVVVRPTRYTREFLDARAEFTLSAFPEKYRKALPYLAKLTKPSDYERFLKNADAILRFDARRELPKIGCRTLIIAGSDDHTVGTNAASELHSAIAGSELYIYEGLGHGAFEEAKDFYDRVLAFCSN